MIRRWTTWAMVMGLALWMTACQGAPSTPRPTAGKDVGVLAAEALASGQYARAAELYRQAVAATPNSVPLRYGLGVAASHIGRRDEAIRELTWVLQNGAQQLSLAVHGRYLLNNVGMLRRLALLGQGIAMLVDEMIAEDLACGRLQRVLPGWQAPSLPVYAITETRLLPAKVRVLIDFLGERLNRR